jgi:hypothetical protein
MAKVLRHANLPFPFKLHLIDSHCTQLYISCLLVWPVPLAQVLPRPQLIFPPKPGFLEFI